jgi:hypothetical protein
MVPGLVLSFIPFVSATDDGSERFAYCNPLASLAR